MIRKVFDDLYYVGSCSYAEHLFERMFEIKDGMSYNSYLLVDEDKTVLFDTVDNSVIDTFLGNIKEVLQNRKLDVLVIQHMEPDHSQAVSNILNLYPDVKIYCSGMALRMLNNILHKDVTSKTTVICPCTKLVTKNHEYSFVPAPFVHWPEVVFTYDSKTKSLFTADAFGSFGANNGYLFADTYLKDNFFYSEMRRYYTNIVGKYGVNVQNVLKKASSIEINTILPLHGLIFRKKEEIAKILDLYNKWSSYTAEDEKDVAIFVGSMYSNTLHAAIDVEKELVERGIRCTLFDVSNYEVSYLVSEAFRVKHIIIASPTYNNGVFPLIENLLTHFVNLNLINRNYYIIESASWCLNASNTIKKILSPLKGSDILQKPLSFLGSFDPDKNKEALKEFVDQIEEKVK